LASQRIAENPNLDNLSAEIIHASSFSLSRTSLRLFSDDFVRLYFIQRFLLLCRIADR
jgi:hypothetical protein